MTVLLQLFHLCLLDDSPFRLWDNNLGIVFKLQLHDFRAYLEFYRYLRQNWGVLLFMLITSAGLDVVISTIYFLIVTHVPCLVSNVFMLSNRAQIRMRLEYTRCSVRASTLPLPSIISPRHNDPSPTSALLRERDNNIQCLFPVIRVFLCASWAESSPISHRTPRPSSVFCSARLQLTDLWWYIMLWFGSITWIFAVSLLCGHSGFCVSFISSWISRLCAHPHSSDNGWSILIIYQLYMEEILIGGWARGPYAVSQLWPFFS